MLQDETVCLCLCQSLSVNPSPTSLPGSIHTLSTLGTSRSQVSAQTQASDAQTAFGNEISLVSFHPNPDFDWLGFGGFVGYTTYLGHSSVTLRFAF